MQDLSALPIAIPYNQIVDFCEKWHVTEFALFGSVLRDDFNDDSDVDVLAQFDDMADYSFADWDDMEQELAVLFNRPVDLIDKQAVMNSPNYIRRKSILNSAQVIYAK
jgi:uncharacterized protein